MSHSAATIYYMFMQCTATGKFSFIFFNFKRHLIIFALLTSGKCIKVLATGSGHAAGAKRKRKLSLSDWPDARLSLAQTFAMPSVANFVQFFPLFHFIFVFSFCGATAGQMFALLTSADCPRCPDRSRCPVGAVV